MVRFFTRLTRLLNIVALGVEYCGCRDLVAPVTPFHGRGWRANSCAQQQSRIRSSFLRSRIRAIVVGGVRRTNLQ